MIPDVADGPALIQRSARPVRAPLELSGRRVVLRNGADGFIDLRVG